MQNPICSCMVMSPPPPKKCDGNCIYAPDLLMADQVTACAGSTDIDISPITTTCGTTVPKFSILSYKNVTGVPTITADKVTFIPANNNYAPAEIVYKVSCGILSASGKIIIVYKNECIDVTCAGNQVCDKCTGICESPNISISVGKTASTFSSQTGIKLG